MLLLEVLSVLTSWLHISFDADIGKSFLRKLLLMHILACVAQFSLCLVEYNAQFLFYTCSNNTKNCLEISTHGIILVERFLKLRGLEWHNHASKLHLYANV